VITFKDLAALGIESSREVGQMVVMLGLTEWMIFEQRLEGDEGMNCVESAERIS
jgi:hypothetical protein